MVVDLANAFFSILMRRDAQRQFAFTSQCHSDSTFTLAPQGFVTFPALCYSVVSGTLITLTFHRLVPVFSTDDIMDMNRKW